MFNTSMTKWKSNVIFRKNGEKIRLFTQDFTKIKNCKIGLNKNWQIYPLNVVNPHRSNKASSWGDLQNQIPYRTESTELKTPMDIVLLFQSSFSDGYIFMVLYSFIIIKIALGASEYSESNSLVHCHTCTYYLSWPKTKNPGSVHQRCTTLYRQKSLPVAEHTIMHQKLFTASINPTFDT